MKKGVFIIFGLLIFGLISGFVYEEKTELTVQRYSGIVVKNSFGEFSIPARFAVIKNKESIVEVVIFSFNAFRPAHFITDPDFVNFQLTKDSYHFWALLLNSEVSEPRPIVSEKDGVEVNNEIVYFVEADTNKRIAVDLELRTEQYNEPLYMLKEWQLFLNSVYEKKINENQKIPVVIDINGLSSLKYTGIRYVLTVEIRDAHEIIEGPGPVKRSEPIK